MNKRQLEIQKIQADNEEKVVRLLKQVYAQARKDCEAKIRELSTRTDMENLQSIVYQKQYQEALKKQIDGILNTLNANSFNAIADYLAASYEDGFFGTLYDLQGQGIPLIFPINQEEVVSALQIESKISNGLYNRLGEDVAYLKKSIRAELSRGAAKGEGWNQIAIRIAKGMNSPFGKAYNRAITIARTEGHRVQQGAAYHCQQRAKSKGADVLKQWDSTLDGLTRPHHRELDGQVRELEEPFEVAGKKGMYPGAFGDPSEDCNCRCCLLQRAKWALSEEEYYTKWDGNKNELVKVQAKTYNDFKDKAKKALSTWRTSTAGKTFKTKKEAFKYFAEQGIKISDSKKYPMDEEIAVKISEWYSKFIETYPSFMEKIVHKITSIKDVAPSALGRGVLGDFRYYLNGPVEGIRLNSELHCWLEYAAKRSAASFESGWHSSNNPIHTFIHEWGHYISHSMDGLQKGFEHSIIKESLEEYKAAHPDYTMGTYVGLKDAVSRYGTSSEAELFAECFAEYFGGTAPREFATIFGKKLEKALKEVK